MYQEENVKIHIHKIGTYFLQEKNRESYNLVYNKFFNIRIDAGFEGNIKLNYTEKNY